jgi:hypothetical protein
MQSAVADNDSRKWCALPSKNGKSNARVAAERFGMMRNLEELS